MIALTKHMAAELAEHNVTINSIAPGPVKTEFRLAANLDAKAAESAYLTNIPMGRLGQPEYITNAAFMLASDDAAYITGHVLNVDGGFIVTGVRDGIYKFRVLHRQRHEPHAGQEDQGEAVER